MKNIALSAALATALMASSAVIMIVPQGALSDPNGGGGGGGNGGEAGLRPSTLHPQHAVSCDPDGDGGGNGGCLRDPDGGGGQAVADPDGGGGGGSGQRAPKRTGSKKAATGSTAMHSNRALGCDPNDGGGGNGQC